MAAAVALELGAPLERVAEGLARAQTAAWRMDVTRTDEGVTVVRPDHRGHGLGAALFEWAIGEARRRHCALVQLTTDKSRADAHRFYERLGFEPSHEGLKLYL